MRAPVTADRLEPLAESSLCVAYLTARDETSPAGTWTELPEDFVRERAWVVVEDGRLLGWSCWRTGQASDRQCCRRASGVVE